MIKIVHQYNIACHTLGLNIQLTKTESYQNQTYEILMVIPVLGSLASYIVQTRKNKIYPNNLSGKSRMYCNVKRLLMVV